MLARLTTALLLIPGLFSNARAGTISNIYKRQNDSDTGSSPASSSDVFGDNIASDPTTDALVDQINSQVIPTNISSPGRQLAGVFSKDQTRSGNYVIVGCGYGQPGSHADELLALLPQVWGNLQIVIKELQTKGMNSNYGALAFFKTMSNLPHVEEMYQAFADGPSTIDVKRPELGPLPPVIICADNEATSGTWPKWCNRHPRTVAWQVPMSNQIILCSAFWQGTRDAPVSADCPTTSRGVVSPNTRRLQYNRQAFLVHEMTHLYTGGGDMTETDYNIADNIALDAEQSIWSASTFAFFYSSVVAKCTSWPNTFSSRLPSIPGNIGANLGTGGHGGDTGL